MNFLMIVLFLCVVILFSKIQTLNQKITTLKKKIDDEIDIRKKTTTDDKVSTIPIQLSASPIIQKQSSSDAQLNSAQPIALPPILPKYNKPINQLKKPVEESFFSWVRGNILNYWLQFIAIVSLGGGLFYLGEWINFNFHLSARDKILDLFLVSAIFLFSYKIKLLKGKNFYDNYKFITQGLGILGFFLTAWFSQRLFLINTNLYTAFLFCNCLILFYYFYKQNSLITLPQKSLFFLPLLGTYFAVMNNLWFSIWVLGIILIKEVFQVSITAWNKLSTTNLLNVLLLALPSFYFTSNEVFLYPDYLTLGVAIIGLSLISLKNKEFVFTPIAIALGIYHIPLKLDDLVFFLFCLSIVSFGILLITSTPMIKKKYVLNYLGTILLFFIAMLFLLYPNTYKISINVGSNLYWKVCILIFMGLFLFKKIMPVLLWESVLIISAILIANYYLSVSLFLLSPFGAYLISKYKKVYKVEFEFEDFVFFPWIGYLGYLLIYFYYNLPHQSSYSLPKSVHWDLSWLSINWFIYIKMIEVFLGGLIIFRNKVFSQQNTILLFNFSTFYLISQTLFLCSFTGIHIVMAFFYIILLLTQLFKNHAIYKVCQESFTYEQSLKTVDYLISTNVFIYCIINGLTLNPLLFDTFLNSDFKNDLINLNCLDFAFLYLLPLLLLKKIVLNKNKFINILNYFSLGFFIFLSIRSFYHTHVQLSSGFENSEMYLYSMLCIASAYYFIQKGNGQLGLGLLVITVIKIYFFDLAFLPNNYKFVLLFIFGIVLLRLNFKLKGKSVTVALHKNE